MSETTHDFQDPMTDTITGWRTVATHGSPTTADLPVFIDDGRSLYIVRVGMGVLQHQVRWVPLSELKTLPDAPQPPRTVTITIDADAAQEVMRRGWTTSHPIDRTLAAVKAALEADEATP